MGINPGLQNELKISLNVHEEHTALLLSPLVMRRLGLAQIDVAYVKSGKVFLIEVKNSAVGMELFGQKRKRLLEAQNFLSQVLNVPVILNCQRQ